MEYLRVRAARTVDEELVFHDAVSDEAAVISVEAFFDVQGDDCDHVKVSSDHDLDFIDDLSFYTVDSPSSQQEQLGAPSLPLPRPCAGTTAFAPVRDISNSPRTVTAVTNKDFVTGDYVDIVGGTYRGKTGAVVKRTPARVQIKLDGDDYSTKKPVNLVPHNVRCRDTSPQSGGVNDAKPISLRTVSSDAFVTGDRVDIIGGTYKGKTGTVVKRTPARVQIKLDGADNNTKKPVTLVPHNVRRQNSSPQTGSVNDAKPSSPRKVSKSNDDFVVGDSVEIIGGAFKDKTGTAVKRTPVRVQVKLDGDGNSNRKPVNLVPHNVRRRDSTRGTGNVNDTELALPTFAKFVIPSDVPISSEDLEKENTGAVVKRTPARVVQVKLDGDDNSTEKPVNLVPHNVRRRDSTRGTGNVNDTELASPTFTKFLVPSDMPISSENADRSVDDSHDSRLVQTVDSASHERIQRNANISSPRPLEPPQAISSPTPPGSHASATSALAQIESKVPSPTPPGSHASATAPVQIESDASGWLVSGGENEKGSPRIRRVFHKIKRYIKRRRQSTSIHS